jgi:hypothetical protein
MRRGASEIHREFVPLLEATAVAHHVLAERSVSLRTLGERTQVRYRLVRALAALAPVQRPEGKESGGRGHAFAPLSSAEIDAALHCDPDGAELAGLYMRRCDLLRAMEKLRADGFGDLDHRPEHRAPAQASGPDDRRRGLAAVELARDPAEDR